MLNISGLQEGIVLDHIEAGKSLDIYYHLGLDHNITVNIIRGDKIAEKRALKLPKKITNVIQCKNPRCITSIEQELPHIFYLADEKAEVYRCQYCEEKYSEYK